MTLENQVCSLGLANRLKELGVKQDAYFDWYEHEGIPYVADFAGRYIDPLKGHHEKLCSAFTVAELGEILLADKLRQIHKSPVGDCWTLPIRTDAHASNRGTDHMDTEANARVKMLIYLIENDLLNVSALR